VGILGRRVAELEQLRLLTTRQVSPKEFLEASRSNRLLALKPAHALRPLVERWLQTSDLRRSSRARYRQSWSFLFKSLPKKASTASLMTKDWWTTFVQTRSGLTTSSRPAQTSTPQNKLKPSIEYVAPTGGRSSGPSSTLGPVKARCSICAAMISTAARTLSHFALALAPSHAGRSGTFRCHLSSLYICTHLLVCEKVDGSFRTGARR
jgi:hypothetical protein